MDPNESLSIRLVGGSETPLVHIIIQHIYRDGVIARDGRLLPGDIILKVGRSRGGAGKRGLAKIPSEQVSGWMEEMPDGWEAVTF